VFTYTLKCSLTPLECFLITEGVVINMEVLNNDNTTIAIELPDAFSQNVTLLLIIIISVTQPDSVMPAWPVGIGWHGINWL